MKKKDLLSILKLYKQENAGKYGILSLGIFGSYARNQATLDSDVDIVVEIERPNILVLAAIKEDLEEKLDRHVDVVRLREHMNNFLRTRIQKEAVYVD